MATGSVSFSTSPFTVKVYYEYNHTRGSNVTEIWVTKVTASRATAAPVTFYFDGIVKIGSTTVITRTDSRADGSVSFAAANTEYTINGTSSNPTKVKITHTAATTVSISLAKNTAQAPNFRCAGGTYPDGAVTAGSRNVSIAKIPQYSLAIDSVNTDVSVTRTKSPNGFPLRKLTVSDDLGTGDVLTIAVSTGGGYKIDTCTVNGRSFSGSTSHTVSANVTVVAIASIQGAVYINNEMYLVYIDNGTAFEQYVPQVDNGSGWDISG